MGLPRKPWGPLVLNKKNVSPGMTECYAFDRRGRVVSNLVTGARATVTTTANPQTVRAGGLGLGTGNFAPTGYLSSAAGAFTSMMATNSNGGNQGVRYTDGFISESNYVCGPTSYRHNNDDGDTVTEQTVTATNLPNGPYVITIVRTGYTASDTITIYINGYINTSALIDVNALPFLAPNNVATFGQVGGPLDIRFWNRALTSREVLAQNKNYWGLYLQRGAALRKQKATSAFAYYYRNFVRGAGDR